MKIILIQIAKLRKNNRNVRRGYFEMFLTDIKNLILLIIIHKIILNGINQYKQYYQLNIKIYGLF